MTGISTVKSTITVTFKITTIVTQKGMNKATVKNTKY